jgi:hypothetical protein
VVALPPFDRSFTLNKYLRVLDVAYETQVEHAGHCILQGSHPSNEGSFTKTRSKYTCLKNFIIILISDVDTQLFVPGPILICRMFRIRISDYMFKDMKG